MKKLLWIVLVIVVIGAGLWIYGNKQVVEVSTKMQKDSTSQDGWKIYTNDTYSFEIQYPTDAKVVNTKDNDILSNGQTILNISFKPSNSEGLVSIIVRNKDNGCYDTALGSDPDFPVVNNVKFTRWNISKYLSLGNDKYGVGQEYCVARNKVTYGLVKQIGYIPGTNVPNIESDKVLNQIVSSFKFTK